jgi:hypothetical protein
MQVKNIKTKKARREGSPQRPQAASQMILGSYSTYAVAAKATGNDVSDNKHCSRDIVAVAGCLSRTARSSNADVQARR